MEEEVNDLEEETSKEVVEGEAEHMKMELKSQVSPVTLKIQSRLHSQTIQGKRSLRNRYAKISWKIKKRRANSSVSSEKDNESRLISQIITGVQNEIRNESVFAGGVTCLPTNGSRAQVSAENRGSNSSNRNDTEEQSVVIYDRLGNLVKKT